MIPVEGYEGLYSVTMCGKVYSHRSKRFLKGRDDHRGYHTVDLKPNKKIHRLVAQAYIPNPKGLPVVNHIDGNKLNNHKNNLEWCSQKHNVQHYINLHKGK